MSSTNPDLTGVSAEARALIESLRDEVARLTDEVTAQKATIRELRRDAIRDPLSGLLNRRGFERVLDRTIDFVRRYDGVVALVFLDLDDFKTINDSLGHAAGDAALRHVATVLTGSLRRSDLVARIGGDEFVALLWKSDEESARETARRVRDGFRRTPFVYDGQPVAMAASVGIASVQKTDSAADVLDRADRDMYRHKTGDGR